MLKVRSAGYFIPNGGCVFAYAFQFDVSMEEDEVEFEAVLEEVTEGLFGA